MFQLSRFLDWGAIALCTAAVLTTISGCGPVGDDDQDLNENTNMNGTPEDGVTQPDPSDPSGPPDEGMDGPEDPIVDDPIVDDPFGVLSCSAFDRFCGTRNARTIPQNETVESAVGFSSRIIEGDEEFAKTLGTVGLFASACLQEGGTPSSDLFTVDANGCVVEEQLQFQESCGCVFLVPKPAERDEPDEPVEFDPVDNVSGGMDIDLPSPEPVCPSGQLPIYEGFIPFGPRGKFYCVEVESDVCFDCSEDSAGWHTTMTMTYTYTARSSADDFEYFDLCSEEIGTVDVNVGDSVRSEVVFEMSYLKN